MDKDVLIGAAIGLGFGIVLTALFMRQKDKGTLLLRDQLGNIIGLLPMGDSFLETTMPSTEPISTAGAFPQSSLEITNPDSFKKYQ